MNRFRSTVKMVAPRQLLAARRAILHRRLRRRFRDASNVDIFSTTYQGKYWGGDEISRFYSGTGSHDTAAVTPYVAAVREWLTSLPEKPDAVDLGCGDFNVGRQLRPFCAGYIACDVVPELIQHNRQVADFADVDFRCLDITSDPLPTGDIVFVRQVMQHLSNADISRLVAGLQRYRYAIVTDAQPPGAFKPNLDIPSGPWARVGIRSGVDLTKEPFCLQVKDKRDLCAVERSNHSVIRTTMYRLH